MNISKGPMKTAKRVCLYGVEGIGKSTFASRFTRPIFIDTEGSTTHMDVTRFDAPKDLEAVIEDIQWVIANPKECGTLVIDTGDSLEKLVFQAVCAEKKIQNLEDLSYGKGFSFAKQKMQQILEMLDIVISRGVHVVIVCHSIIRKFELPDAMGSYDRYTLKLNDKNIAPLIKEWVDMLLFVNYKTDIVTDEKTKTKKGTGGQKRVMYANHSACWDAKNRFGLPDEMPFEYDQIASLFDTAEQYEEQPAEKPVEKPAQKPAVKKVDKVPETRHDKLANRPAEMRSDNPDKDVALGELWTKMIDADIEEPAIIRTVVADKEYYDFSVPVNEYDLDFIRDVLIEAWDQVKSLCLTKIHDLPF
jgi:GTPase SAR1 family protein